MLTGCGKKKEESKTNYMVLVNKQSKLPENCNNQNSIIKSSKIFGHLYL